MLAENMQNGMVRLKEGGEGRGLFPVLQPSGNPYAETHPMGDAWLQSMWKEGKQLPCLVGLFLPAVLLFVWGLEAILMSLSGPGLAHVQRPLSCNAILAAVHHPIQDKLLASQAGFGCACC